MQHTKKSVQPIYLSLAHLLHHIRCRSTALRFGLILWAALASGLLTAAQVQAQTQPTFSESGFTTEVVTTVTSSNSAAVPVGITFAPDGRMFITVKNGVVRIYKNGSLLTTPFIDISAHVNSAGDRGLLGLALDPNFSTNGYVYLLYTYENGSNTQDTSAKTARLTRVKADPNNPDVATSDPEVVLLGSIGTPPCSNYAATADCIADDSISHTIGTLRFAPDGKLFVGSGDGADFNAVDPLALRAQDLNSLNGKLLRINSDGSAPSDNPFYDANSPASNRSKVWAYGLRNPYRFNLDPTYGEPYMGDVGWGAWEEIDTGRGANFGWPCYEGDGAQPGYQSDSRTSAQCALVSASSVKKPLFTYPHQASLTNPPSTVVGNTVIGGPFYNATQYPTMYRGNYFFADYGQGWIRRMVLNGNDPPSVYLFATGVSSPVALELGPDGLLYYVAIYSREIRRIRYGGPSAAANATPSSGYSPLTVNFSSAGSTDPNGLPLSYLWDFGDGTTSTQANPTHTYNATGVQTFTAKLTVTNSQNQSSSATVNVTVGSKPPSATITAPSNNAAYPIGTTVNFQGSATDPEDGTLPASAFSWTVLLHHDEHIHIYSTANGTTSGSFVIQNNGQGTFYYEIVLTVTDSSKLTDTRRINVYISTSSTLTAPTNLVATAGTSSTQVGITWNASTGGTVNRYEVERSANVSGPYTLIGSTTATSFTDTTASAGITYLYRVRAFDAAGNYTGFSNSDPTTTIIFADDPLAAQEVVKAQHLTELRQAVNAMRAAANLRPAVWTDASLLDANGDRVVVKAQHWEELRAYLDEALRVMNLPTGGYTDPVLSGVIISRTHVTELRQRVK